jgi:hypothetical protein
MGQFLAIGQAAAKGGGIMNSLAAEARGLESSRDLAQQEQDEIARQSGFVEQDAKEEASLRVREARKQQASLVATLIEGGARAGGGNFTAFGNEVAFNTGTDLNRIVGNRERQLSALKSRAVASRKAFQSQSKQFQYATIGAVFDLGGAALDGKAQYDDQQFRRQQTEQTGTLPVR